MKTAIKWKVGISEACLILLDTYRQYIHIFDLLIILLLIQLPSSISFKYPQMSQVQHKDIKMMFCVSNESKTGKEVLFIPLPVLDIYSTISQIY